jgi:hypothetical protein
VSRVLGAFGLLNFTMLRPVLAWRAFWNLWTVYLFNFPFFSGRSNPRILNQRIWKHDCIYSHPAITFFRTYVLWPQTQRAKQSAHIRKYNAGYVFEFLNYHYQDLTRDYFAEFRIQSTLEEPDEPECQPEPELEPKERTMTISNLTEVFWPNKGSIKASEGTDSKEQGTASTR